MCFSYIEERGVPSTERNIIESYTQFKLTECTTQMQLHQAFLDRCIELLVDHKINSRKCFDD